MINFLINFVQFLTNQHNFQITEGMQPNYLGGLSLPSTPGLLSLISSGIKNKRTELDDRILILCHEKVGGQKY